MRELAERGVLRVVGGLLLVRYRGSSLPAVSTPQPGRSEQRERQRRRRPNSRPITTPTTKMTVSTNQVAASTVIHNK